MTITYDSMGAEKYKKKILHLVELEPCTCDILTCEIHVHATSLTSTIITSNYIYIFLSVYNAVALKQFAQVGLHFFISDETYKTSSHKIVRLKDNFLNIDTF